MLWVFNAVEFINITGDRVDRNTRRDLLPLLPSGPDGVHKPSLYGTRPYLKIMPGSDS